MSRDPARQRREGDLRGADVGNASGLSPIYGARGLSNTNRLQTGAGTGENGNAVIGWCGVELFSIDSQGVASANRTLAAVNDTTGTTFGWQLRSQTTNATIQFGIRQTGGAAMQFTSSFTVTAAMLGKILHIAWVVDVVGGQMKLYVDGALVGAATVITAYGLPDTASPESVGALAAGAGGADGTTWYGRATGHGVMTQAEIAAHRAACVLARDIVPLSGAGITATHTNSVKAGVVAAGDVSVVPTTIPDSTGSGPMTKQGSPTLVARRDSPWV